MSKIEDRKNAIYNYSLELFCNGRPKPAFGLSVDWTPLERRIDSIEDLLAGAAAAEGSGDWPRLSIDSGRPARDLV